MFYRLLFLLSIISPFILSAQIATEIKLEPALISVIYERRMEYDTLNRNNKVRINTLTLKAGKNHSAFYDARLKWIDSMEYINDDYIHSLYEGVKYYSTKGALHQIKLFKNYPEGKIRIHDAFDLCRWHIDEDIEKPEWNIIADSTTNILGYECMLAVARFRGREWHAWFSPEIPFPDGPWKLWGLPGLILKAYDSNQDYIFTAQEISDKNTGYVEYFDYAHHPHSRQADAKLCNENGRPIRRIYHTRLRCPVCWVIPNSMSRNGKSPLLNTISRRPTTLTNK